MASHLDRPRFAPGQCVAFDAGMRWIEDPGRPQVLRLFGYAGTGKTTIAKALVANSGRTRADMAITGKAARS